MPDTTGLEKTSDGRDIVPYDKRRGLSICIISRGQIPTTWFSHMVEKITKKIPSGIYWNYIIKVGTPETTGDNYATLRNKCVEEALARGSKWVFFVDDDVFLLENSISQMLKHARDGKKVVSGVYYKKSEEVEPVIFKRLGDGPYYNFPPNSVFEIEGSGAGCMWIDTEVFDTFRKNGVPYFNQDWYMDLEKGGGKKQTIQVEIGEDHWLYYQAKKLGYPSWCDSSLTCDHYDFRTGKMFPVDKEVYRIAGISLREREEQMKDMVQKFQEHKKRNIIFVVPSAVGFNGRTIYEKPLGGSETAVVHTAKGLAKDHNVVVLCNTPIEGNFEGVPYLSLSKMDMFNDMELDVVVMVRNHMMVIDPGFKKRLKASQYWLWMQDYPMYPGFENFLQIKGHVDKFICVSEDHRQAFKARFPCQLDDEDFVVIENGVDKKMFKLDKPINKQSRQFYYSSTPFRGLEVLVDVWPRIKQKLPDATLKVCSGLEVYGQKGNQYEELFEKCKNTDGIEYVGSVSQPELFKIAKESEMLLYPCIFAETNCITAAEAQTAGSPVIASDLAALKNTVHDGCGVLIPGNPKTKEWQDKFVDTVVDLGKNPNKLIKLINQCLKQNFDWSVSVKKWNQQLKQSLKEWSTVQEYSGGHTTTTGMTNNLEQPLISDTTTSTNIDLENSKS